MCLAIPARVVELIDESNVVIDLGGVRKQVSTALVDGAALGDYLIIHVGYAIGRIDPDEARRTLEMFAELSATANPEQP